MSLPLDKAETEKKKLISCFIDSFFDKSLKSRLSSFLDKEQNNKSPSVFLCESRFQKQENENEYNFSTSSFYIFF